MTEKLKQIIEEEVVKMPREFQEAFAASNWIQVSEDIARKYNLFSDEEQNIFQAEVFLIIAGIEDFDSFVPNLQNELGIEKSDGAKISDEVFDRIISPFSDKIESKVQWKMDIKNSKWDQNIEFITSGGDYSAFLDIKKNKEVTKEEPVTNIPIKKLE